MGSIHSCVVLDLIAVCSCVCKWKAHARVSLGHKHDAIILNTFNRKGHYDGCVFVVREDRVIILLLLP